MAFHLTNKAKADLKNIARYTRHRWGKNQRDSYLIKIDEAFHLLSEKPKIGRDSTHIRKGYRKYQVGKHLIFYRMANQTDIEIVRILHEFMDTEYHLNA